MNNKNEYIDQLFTTARETEPIVSFEALEKSFHHSLDKRMDSDGKINWGKILTFKNLFIMLGIISSVIVATSLIFAPNNQATNQKNNITQTMGMDEDNTEQHSSITSTTEKDNKIISIRKTEIVINEEQNESKIAVHNPTNQNTVNSIQQHTNNYFNPTYQNVWGTKKKQNESEFVYTITNATTNEELAGIKRQAQSAEVEFEYKTRKKGSIKKLDIKLSRGGQRSSINYELPRKFEITIGWEVDEKGIGISLYEDPKNEIRNNVTLHFDSLTYESELAINNMLIRLFPQGNSI